jgi:phosphate transport system substrate-binding protein
MTSLFRRQSNVPMRTILAITAGAALLASISAIAAVNVVETGSSLLYPLFNLWQPVYTKAHPDVKLTTASTGSGTGQAESMQGLVQIGASDAYLSDAQMKEHPSMLNIPLAISSQMVNFNLPGLNDQHLKLSGPLLAGIYAGKVSKWNAPEIAKLNPGVKLPDPKTVKAAAAAMVPKTPADQRISLIFAPGKDSYPIINY